MNFKYALAASFLLLLMCFIAFNVVIAGFCQDSSIKADAIIVLTGGHDRIASGIKLLKEEKGQRLLLSGVNKNISDSLMLQYLKIHDYNLINKIDLGHNAINTAGNAKEAEQWVKIHNYKKLYIVTNDYHMPRTLLEMKLALPQDISLIAYAIKDNSWWQIFSFYRFLNIISEFFKYSKTNAKYYLIYLFNYSFKS